MKPIILDTPGHESAINDVIAEKAKKGGCALIGNLSSKCFSNGIEVEHLFIDEALNAKTEIFIHPISRAASQVANLAASLPIFKRSKHAKARQLRFRAKHL